MRYRNRETIVFPIFFNILSGDTFFDKTYNKTYNKTYK